MTHTSSHPLAYKTVVLSNVAPDPRGLITNGKEFRVEDWVDRLPSSTGEFESWKAQDNWATTHYARRQKESVLNNGPKLPDDDEVVYGHIGTLGHCVHQSELDHVVGSPAGMPWAGAPDPATVWPSPPPSAY